MRKWMNLLESEAPDILYHGTPIENVISMLMTGMIHAREEIDKGHFGVSWTSDLTVAKGFAHSDSRDGDLLHTEILQIDQPIQKGAVLVARSSALGRLDEYDDGGDGLKSEAEWRTYGDVPFSAVHQVIVDRRELEEYRATLLAHRDHEPQSWPEVDPKVWPAHYKWAKDFLADPKRLAAIDGLLNGPLLRDLNESAPGKLYTNDGEQAVGYWYNPRSKQHHVIAWDAADNTNTHSDHCDVALDHRDWFGLNPDEDYGDCDTVRADVVQNGWARIGFNPLSGMWMDAKNPKIAHDSAKWFVGHHGVPSRITIDICNEAGYTGYGLAGSDLTDFLATGRLHPALAKRHGT